MTTRQTQAFLLHIERLRPLYFVLSFLDVAYDAFLLQFREGVLDRLNVILLQLPLDDGIVGPVDEGILRCLVLDDTHLRIDIILHLEVVTVQMVGCDVQEDGDIGTEVIHIIQLEGAELDDIILMRIFSHLQRQRITDIACETCIVACLLEDMVDQTRGRRLTIRTRDTDHLRIGIPAGKLNLTDDVDSLLFDLHDHRSRIRDARTLDDLVGIQDFFFRMLTLLPLNLVVVEHLLILIGNLRHIRHEHVESFFLREDGSTRTALSCS